MGPGNCGCYLEQQAACRSGCTIYDPDGCSGQPLYYCQTIGVVDLYRNGHRLVSANSGGWLTCSLTGYSCDHTCG